MADHRYTSSFRRDMRLLSPASLRQLTFWDVWWPVLAFVTFGVLMPSVWWVLGERVAALVFAGAGVANMLVELILAGRHRRSRLENNIRESELLDLQARIPNGAPDLAYIREHCGCISRHRFVSGGWMREITLSYDDHCPVRAVAHANHR